MRTSTLRFVKYWLPFLVWSLVVFMFSSFPTGQATEIHWGDFIIKKTAHVVEYAVFSVLLYRATRAYGLSRKHAAYTSIVSAIIYGFTDEFHQSFTPGREPHLRDVGFDTIGAVLGIYSLWNIIPKMPVTLRNWAVRLELV